MRSRLTTPATFILCCALGCSISGCAGVGVAVWAASELAIDAAITSYKAGNEKPDPENADDNN